MCFVLLPSSWQGLKFLKLMIAQMRCVVKKISGLFEREYNKFIDNRISSTFDTSIHLSLFSFFFLVYLFINGNCKIERQLDGENLLYQQQDINMIII